MIHHRALNQERSEREEEDHKQDYTLYIAYIKDRVGGALKNV